MKRTIALAVIGLMAAPMASAGVIYGFDNVTANDVNDAATGEAQLTVEVSDGGLNLVDFIFRNAGPLLSSITDVYFDDGTLLGIAAIIGGGAGVDFAIEASPGDLPGGNGIDFNASSSSFTADSNPPAQPNGVNPGESLTIRFNLINGQTYADTLAALALSLANPGVDVVGGLRIGIHVQGFDGGGSESFVNGPPRTTVPEPASIVLLGLGLAALGLTRRRRTA